MSELEMLLTLSLVIELHIPSFEKVSPNINKPLDWIFGDFPLRNPLPSIEFSDADIFRS